MFCPKCGRKVSEEFDFCPYCGYDLRKVKSGMQGEIEESLPSSRAFNVFVNGVSRDFRFTGKDSELNLGELTLEDALKIFGNLPEGYSKKERRDIEKGKKIPATMILDGPEGALFIYLNPDGTYMVQGGVRELEAALDLTYDADERAVIELIKRFYTDPGLIEEWKSKITQLKKEEEEERPIAEGRLITDSDVFFTSQPSRIYIHDDRIVVAYDNELTEPDVLPYDIIEEVKLKKGWLSARIEIRYRSKKGKTKKIRYDLKKGDYDEIRNALLRVIPEKVKG